MRRERVLTLRQSATGDDEAGDPRVVTDEPPDDPDFLRWWMDNRLAPTGTGTTNLHEFGRQAAGYWHARREPNVHLFHYADLQDDRDAQMRRVARALGTTIDESRWPDLVEAAGLDAMRAARRRPRAGRPP